MPKLKGLIVDDSKLVQEVLKAIFASDADIEIVGVAENGREAISKVKALKPDFVTMDIQMPIMGGLEAMEHIMADDPLPIFVISDHTDAQTAFQALSKGALEIIPKTDIYPGKATIVLARIKLLARTSVTRHARVKPVILPKREIIKAPPAPETIKRDFDKVVAIACSTGGPKALGIILSEIPVDFPYPILVAQHMAEGFIPGLVKWINDVCHIEVKEGTWGAALAPGLAYISPVDKHMTVNGKGEITFAQRVESDFFHPSCNKLLTSVGLAFGENTIGVILTGMGDDGVEGLKVIKEKGGTNLAQDEETCVVFGMPKVAIKAGCIDQVLPLQKISSYLTTLANSLI